MFSSASSTPVRRKLLVLRKLLRPAAYRLYSHGYKLNFVSSSQGCPHSPWRSTFCQLCTCASSVICSWDHPCFDLHRLWQHFLFVVWAVPCILVLSKMDRVCIYVPLSYFKIFSKMIRWWEKYTGRANMGGGVISIHYFLSSSSLRNLTLIL